MVGGGEHANIKNIAAYLHIYIFLKYAEIFIVY